MKFNTAKPTNQGAKPTNQRTRNGVTKLGPLKTSMDVPVTKAAPRKAMRQGGDLVGGMPVNFGVGSSSMKGKGKGRGPKRMRMY